MVRFWSLFCAFVLFGVSAAADQIPGTQSNVAGWSLGAYTNEKTGRFSHCAMSAVYKSGISLIFSISGDYSWRVAWASKNWRLQKGQKVDLSLFVDGGAPYNLSAIAVDEALAIAELPDNAALFDHLRKGYRLTVWAQGNRYDFNLDGTFAALAETHACVARLGAPPAPKSPPPLVSTSGPKPAEQPTKQQVTAEQQLEATTLVANLLAQGDLSGFKILTPKERQDEALKGFSDWHVIWRSDSVGGVLKILPKMDGITPGAITAFLLGDDAKGCGEGQFASGTVKDEKSPNISRLFTACKTATSSWNNRYIVVPRVEGGYYLFGTFTVGKGGGEGKIEEVDGLLRASVFNVLKR